MVATWTPGDVNVAKGRGGLVRIASTHVYRAQMPNAIIGIRKFNKDNADKVAAMLAAVFEGGDQVKAFPQALDKAGEISAKVYNDQDGKYWVRYYKGVTERDTKGLEVELGGSKAFNLADNLALFGLDGGNNNARSTYTTFSKIVLYQYPKLFADTPIPDFKDAATTKYIMMAQSAMETGTAGSAEQAHFSASGETGALVSKRSYYITFTTGSARIVGAGQQTMEELKDQLAIAGGAYITVDGYTDNVGNPDSNRQLSQMRADAVRQYLQHLAPKTFPSERFRIAGHGPDNPVADNATEAGRSRNRRVEITLSES
jgi:outer membrane protein OmpA-like peptidoglycan-associated protein